MPADGGEARRLTEGKEGVDGIAWSPDSSRIAFVRRVRDEAYEEEDDAKRAPRRFRRLFYKFDGVGWTGDRRRHLFVVDLAGGEAAPADRRRLRGRRADWTPDGTRIVFSAMRGERWDTELVARLYEVDADGGEPRQLTGDDGSYGEPHASLPTAHGSPTASSPRTGRIHVTDRSASMNADGTGPRLLTTSLDRQCQAHPLVREPIWDGERIVFTVEDRGNVHLYAVAADGSPGAGARRRRRAVDRPLRRRRRAARLSRPRPHTEPMELYAGTEAAKRTTSAGLQSPAAELVEPERFIGVSADGTEVDAWLVRPAGFEEGERYPVLLTIHGGPFAQYGTGFFDEFQVYAGGGYAVLFANPRGGSGRWRRGRARSAARSTAAAPAGARSTSTT